MVADIGATLAFCDGPDPQQSAAQCGAVFTLLGPVRGDRGRGNACARCGAAAGCPLLCGGDLWDCGD